jgi:hypothetical protein
MQQTFPQHSPALPGNLNPAEYAASCASLLAMASVMHLLRVEALFPLNKLASVGVALKVSAGCLIR